LFEGFTSYYDDLFLRRSGLIDEAAYLKLVSKTINAVQRGAGRKKQSVADSSFEAWSKYYRQDENATNAIVSYYTKGSLVALGLDLMIRRDTQGKKSLDDVMRALWKQFGRDFYLRAKTGTQSGLDEDGFAAIVLQATGLHVKPYLTKFVLGTEDVPLADLYADFGVQFAPETKTALASLGARFTKSGADCKLAAVFENGAAHRAGLSAGDSLIAIGGLRVTAADAANNLSNLLAAYAVGSTIQVHAFRRDELVVLDVKLQADDTPNFNLSVVENAKKKSMIKRPSH
jgi:predicted metalloprotease with PDZ domain